MILAAQLSSSKNKDFAVEYMPYDFVELIGRFLLIEGNGGVLVVVGGC